MQRKLKALVKLHHQLRETADHSELSYLKLTFELLTVVFGKNKLKIDDYFNLCLYDNKLYPSKELPTFVGRKYMKKRIHAKMNAIRWEVMQIDKYIQSCMFEQFGIPHPELQAVIARYHRQTANLPLLRSDSEIKNFLKNTASYPLFVKPIKGGYGRGAIRAEQYDSVNDKVVLSNGEKLDPDGFINYLQDPQGYGFIVQQAIVGTPETRDVCGNIPSGLRLVTILGDDGTTILRVIWKIPTGNNYVDNFQRGKSGNLLASVDPNSGKIQRIVKGAGFGLELTDSLPGGSFKVGDTVPHWDAAKELVMKATPVFTGFRCQHWDIGLSNDGPVAFEVNADGGWDVVQIAHGFGAMDNELVSILNKYGDCGSRSHFANH